MSPLASRGESSGGAQAWVGFVVLVCIPICWHVWKRKGGEPVWGALLGLLLGPIGLAIVLSAHPKVRKSPASKTAPPPARPSSLPPLPSQGVATVEEHARLTPTDDQSWSERRGHHPAPPARGSLGDSWALVGPPSRQSGQRRWVLPAVIVERVQPQAPQ